MTTNGHNKSNNNSTCTSTSTSSSCRAKYRSIVLDSGPIIKLTTTSNISSLRNCANEFYTVPTVINEIRDAKARQHLETLTKVYDINIKTRLPSSESIQTIIEFAKLTGDYQSLSSVDIQVLALVYELEVEGCSNNDHVRKIPKRILGVGKVKLLSDNKNKSNDSNSNINSNIPLEEEKEYYEVHSDDDDDADDENRNVSNNDNSTFIRKSPVAITPTTTPSSPKTWAGVVNSSSSSSTTTTSLSDELLSLQMNNKMKNNSNNADGDTDSDAKDAEYEEKLIPAATATATVCSAKQQQQHDFDLNQQLQKDFPSLAASIHVPYEGDVDDNDENVNDNEHDENNKKDNIIKNNKNSRTNKTDIGTSIENSGEMIIKDDKEEERKIQGVKSISKSGKLYNSFRGYGKLFKPKLPPHNNNNNNNNNIISNNTNKQYFSLVKNEISEKVFNIQKEESRIMGGINMSGQEVDVEDDGEGWINCTGAIQSLQATGTLVPTKKNALDKANTQQGPPHQHRTACATTDFAMQNVLLQMNLELLSVDGVKIRVLKSWIFRCGACFKIYTNNNDAGPNGMKRLFCERCGSDMLQRIAASVDGKTGRLRLHMSKKHKTSTRGTKYSLPKPGTGNRFQGDLLLREDQVLMGAWNQKIKLRSGGKAKSAAQSMFGQDIATEVGCSARSMNVNDIAPGFGKRNPNAAKGRERRGKKKKSSEKACGLRRYR